ncbi:hypothetical protein ACXPWS_16325 [Mycobacterium sp. BMJ-28]
MAGYTVGDNEITLLHIATAPVARQSGVGRRMLGAVRRAIPTTLPLIAETDTDGVGFYIATGFTVISLGESTGGGEIPRTPRITPVRRQNLVSLVTRLKSHESGWDAQGIVMSD